MNNKYFLIIYNKCFMASNEKLIDYCLDNNPFISHIAIDFLIKKCPSDINVSDEVLDNIIKKLTIEQLWTLVNYDVNNRLCLIAYNKLNEILDYYDLIHQKQQNKKRLLLIKGKKPI